MLHQAFGVTAKNRHHKVHSHQNKTQPIVLKVFFLIKASHAACSDALHEKRSDPLSTMGSLSMNPPITSPTAHPWTISARQPSHPQANPTG